MGHAHPRSNEYSFCPHCASELQTRRVEGYDRRCCGSCGYIHYRNPSVAAVVIAFDDTGRVLMVHRGPRANRAGYWSFPGGFVDDGEHVRTAATRELREETGLEVELDDVLDVTTNLDDPSKSVIVVSFSARVVGGTLAPGDDAVDAEWFDLDSLPPLAFSTDDGLLERIRMERDNAYPRAMQHDDRARRDV